MDHNAYQLLALGARYWFVLLAAVLVWRGAAALLHEHYQRKKLLKKLPDAESLLRTLTFYYLDADCRITETAQAMYLHRNTVKYRLNKVHNLLQVRLGNPADLHFMQRLSGYYRLYSVS